MGTLSFCAMSSSVSILVELALISFAKPCSVKPNSSQKSLIFIPRSFNSGFIIDKSAIMNLELYFLLIFCAKVYIFFCIAK